MCHRRNKNMTMLAYDHIHIYGHFQITDNPNLHFFDL